MRSDYMEENEVWDNYALKRESAHRVLQNMEIKMSQEYLTTGSISTEEIIKYINYSDAKLGRPIGSHLTMLERVKHYYFVIVNNTPCIHKDFERQAKSKLKARVRKRVEEMENPVFFTQTFNEEKLPDNAKQYMDYWRKVFSSCDIENWVLVSDYGADYHRLHFHGFLDLPKKEYDLLVREFEEVKGNKKSEATTPHFRIEHILTLKNKTRTVITFVPFSQYGYNSILILNDKTIDVNTSINYCTKYLLKDMDELGLKHEVFGSRTKRQSNN